MRRVFRRHIRKTLAHEVPPVLQEAIFVFDKGEYGQAAELFERLAQSADERGGPRAHRFYLQAGRARILAGQTNLSMPSLKRGLELLAQRGQLHKLQQTGEHVISELNEHGLSDEASEIENLLHRIAPPMPAMETQRAPAQRPPLPTRCPSCGAVMRPDEVEWMDDATAECGYCGSPVRDED
jgi:hypothetical protein